MGVNAQTSVPAFTAGQILTAAEMTEVNTGIPVFATTVTRDAAFGGTGEKVLAEGQYAYIETTDTLQVYTGAAWITAAQTPGLACVKAETAFSAVSSVNIDTVFSSSYTNYKLKVNFTGTTADVVSLQLRVGGVAATTNYNSQRFLVAGTSLIQQQTATSSLAIAFGSTGSFNSYIDLDIYQPAIATATKFWSIGGESNTSYADNAFELRNSNHSTATAYDGLALTIAGGTMSGSYTVYGFSKVAS
jgi:hypothetical protein